ncbi:rhodanese-like domain-containing protein [Kangiella shandongensis]|uniref:rhodanese-like domain-containing protein n=1 Tax=Kangiella shandongensis TaxID=2763258 RepID=UPI001CC10779|nr:rhodanese-like domain-containing protein [Kangiella shandongensis]
MKPCVANYLSNIKQQINEVSVEDVKHNLPQDALIIDVREPAETQQGMVEGAVNIPRGVLEFKLFAHDCVNGLCDEDLFNKPIYLYCASGGRSACCAHTLQQLGFNNVYSVDGGFKKWVERDGGCTQP